MTDWQSAKQLQDNTTPEMVDNLLSAIVDQIMLLSRDGKILYINQSMQKTLGLKPEDIVGLHWSEVIMPNGFFKPIRQHLPEVLGRKKAVCVQHERPVNNDTAYFEYLITPVSSDTGTAQMAMVQIRDISEQRQMNTAVEDSQTRLGITLDNSPIGMAMLDVGGVLFTCNQKLCEMYSVTHKSMLGKNIRKLIYEDDLEEFLVMIECMLEGKQLSFQQILRMCDDTQSTFWTELTMTMVRNSLGQPHYFIVQIVDIRFQKSLEIKVLQQQQYSDVLLNELSNAAIVVDGQGAIRQWNTKVNMLFGYSDQDLGELNLQALFTDEVAIKLDSYVEHGGTLESITMLDRLQHIFSCDLKFTTISESNETALLVQVLRH